jgi:hypothetical protein
MSLQKLAEVEKKLERRADYSVLALLSFVVAFAVSRIFTIISSFGLEPTSGIYIHHFWYGLIMVGIGGWLGISYSDERTKRFATVIFGLGGGLIGDESGMLLVMNPNDYQTVLTYPIIAGFLAFCIIFLLLKRHSQHSGRGLGSSRKAIEVPTLQLSLPSVHGQSSAPIGLPAVCSVQPNGWNWSLDVAHRDSEHANCALRARRK